MWKASDHTTRNMWKRKVKKGQETANSWKNDDMELQEQNDWLNSPSKWFKIVWRREWYEMIKNSFVGNLGPFLGEGIYV